MSNLLLPINYDIIFYTIVTSSFLDGTDNHLILVDLRPKVTH